MPGVDANLIRFQCPRCGCELEQTIGLLKAGKRIVCTDCNVGINIDSARLVAATEALSAAVLPGPNEITIKFFR
ncbi:MAG TPA: hypothetical protein VNQ74_15095 [Burkholderiaceae bacterium]|nr:hypothetical protein [Burkholderiaceae bacterium]